MRRILLLMIATLWSVHAENSTEQCDAEGIVNRFVWQDYSVLAAMLIISVIIGLYYGLKSKKHSSSDDFLLGGSSMGTGPVALSIGTSFITAIELLGNPAEAYNYGTQYWMIIIAFILVVPITSKLYLPVFANLRLTSCYEYLELRFSKPTRIISSTLYIVQMILYTSVAVYAPALALNNVTGVNTYLIIAVIYIVCITYALLGGMKAVIITDTFQTIVLIASLITVMVIGDKLVGGYGAVFSHAYKTDRLELWNMNPDPRIRHSFWTVVVGGTFYWTTMFCANQASIQKYLTVEKISQVRSALWIASIGLILVYTINFYTGMIITANFKDCDPLRAGIISASDQLLPLYVINVLGHMKGMTGFFVAGICAASLGTVAAALTSISAATIQDFVMGAFKFELTDAQGARMAKYLAGGAGVISFALIFVVERLGSVLQVALSFNGMVGGVNLGLFSLGMFFPWANAKGAVTGSIIGLGLVMWIGLGQQIALIQGKITYETKETSIEGCVCLNETLALNGSDGEDDVLEIYRVSYLLYAAIGCLTTFIVGVIVSMLTKPTNPHDVSVDLMSPPFIRLYSSFPERLQVKFNLKKDADASWTTNSIGTISQGVTTLDVGHANGGFVGKMDEESDIKLDMADHGK